MVDTSFEERFIANPYLFFSRWRNGGNPASSFCRHFLNFRVEINLLLCFDLRNRNFHSVFPIGQHPSEPKKMVKLFVLLLLVVSLSFHVDSLPYHYAKNRQRIARGVNTSRLSPSISFGASEAALSKYKKDYQVRKFLFYFQLNTWKNCDTVTKGMTVSVLGTPSFLVTSNVKSDLLSSTHKNSPPAANDAFI